MKKFFYRLWTRFILALKTLFVDGGFVEVYHATPDTPKMKLRQLPHEEIMKYDKNGDGVVDEKDVTALVNDILMGNYDPGLDLNGDGETDISDVVGFVNIILDEIDAFPYNGNDVLQSSSENLPKGRRKRNPQGRDAAGTGFRSLSGGDSFRMVR